MVRVIYENRFLDLPAAGLTIDQVRGHQEIQAREGERECQALEQAVAEQVSQLATFTVREVVRSANRALAQIGQARMRLLNIKPAIRTLMASSLKLGTYSEEEVGTPGGNAIVYFPDEAGLRRWLNRHPSTYLLKEGRPPQDCSAKAVAHSTDAGVNQLQARPECAKPATLITSTSMPLYELRHEAGKWRVRFPHDGGIEEGILDDLAGLWMYHQCLLNPDMQLDPYFLTRTDSTRLGKEFTEQRHATEEARKYSNVEVNRLREEIKAAKAVESLEYVETLQEELERVEYFAKLDAGKYSKFKSPQLENARKNVYGCLKRARIALCEAGLTNCAWFLERNVVLVPKSYGCYVYYPQPGIDWVL